MTEIILIFLFYGFLIAAVWFVRDWYDHYKAKKLKKAMDIDKWSPETISKLLDIAEAKHKKEKKNEYSK